MWRKILTGVAVIMLIVGVGLFIFPIVSNFIGNIIANSETEKFDERLDNIVDDITFDDALKDGMIDDEGYLLDENGNRKSDTPVLFKADLDRLYKDSLEYNENLKNNQSSHVINNNYYTEPSLELSSYGINDGIYGYVSAPSIDMKLPIYLGANSENMSYGAAHMTYTSLPVGGENTNTVLAGHTGYVGRIFFDNLRNLKIGDEVTLHNYWQTLNYRVSQTKVCKPDESQDIFIKDGKDLLTMITCISNNSGYFDRYYVICERTE